MEHIRARLHPGRSYAEWGAAVADTAATLQLIVQRDSRTTTVASVTAEQFSGVAVVGGADPAYLWTAYDGEQWSVTLRQGGEQRVLYSGAAVALGPALVRDESGALWYAWTSRAGTTDTIRLTSEGSSDTITPAGALAEPHAGRWWRRGLFRAPLQRCHPRLRRNLHRRRAPRSGPAIVAAATQLSAAPAPPLRTAAWW